MISSVSGMETMQLFGLSETQIVGVAIAAFVLAVTVAIVFSSKKSKERMSHHFREMRVGDYMSVKRPKGRFKYQPGQASVRAFGMLAGGSGISPMFQVARAVLENLNDTTKVHLIYSNVCLEDMLLKEEIDRLASNYPDRFKVYSH
nr:PREDICTED: NADH--cytochrome b5 reductase 1-like isoform X2 [Daucus carota subsp. sativus]XP_017249206.1 PREDICTED: NADH--cytochrome b5 reductase 1-like isoform X2 [Daucus carota subsp. sativus]